jgi:Acetyltransferase (GNAT) family
VEAEAAALHEALSTGWEQVYAAVGGSFERRSELIALRCPQLPIPQANGAWIEQDTEAAAAGLAGAIDEAESQGLPAWVQTRSHHTRARQAATDLGLTHSEHVPAMVVRPGELAILDSAATVDLISVDEVGAAVEILAAAFAAPVELFDWFCRVIWSLDGASWYVARVGGEVVSTGVGYTLGPATGVFNVATPSEQRGRGYGAAVTARCVQDGFDAGAEFAYLQSSDLGHGVYRRLGFRDVEEYILLTRPVVVE